MDRGGVSMDKDYEDFVARMGSFDMDIEVVDTPNEDDQLQHHGVLGMKWGIRRYQPYTGGKKGTFLNKKKKQYATAAERNKAYQEAKRSAPKKAVNKFVNSKRGSKYKLHSDPKKELAEVEGKNPQKKTKPPKVKKTHLSKKKQAEADMKSMDDQELRQRINRLQMEKQYTQLSVGEKNTGQKAASMALNKIGNKVMDRVIDRAIIDPIDDFFKGRG